MKKNRYKPYNSFKFYTLLVLIIASVFTVAACGKKDKQTSQNKKNITIKGSDTMVHLMSSLAEA
ncbi:MAG TPA: hypothetical protein VGK25_00525, partial [Ignavibacteria bacterium]